MRFSDAHGHFHTFGLEKPLLEKCRRAICCGTHPGDWQEVLCLSDRDSRIEPAFGLHPWYLAEAQPDWLETLRGLLGETPRASIGEIGLDRTRRSPALDEQEVALRSQLAMALEFRRPVTLHCVRAWGRLLRVLDEAIPPDWPVMLHDFRAPGEMIPLFLARSGSLFSFGALPCIETLREIPAHRIVYESDAFSGATSSRSLDGARKAIISVAIQQGEESLVVNERANAALDRFLEHSPAA